MMFILTPETRESWRKFGIIFGIIVVFVVAVNATSRIMLSAKWEAVPAEPESSMKSIVLEKDKPIVIQGKDEAPKELLSKDFKREILKDTTGYKLSDFELQEEIGSGSYGIVFKAKDKRTNKTVAIKAHLFGREANRSIKRQFFKERRFLQLLKDAPFICKPIWNSHISKQDALRLFNDEKLQGISVLEYYPKCLADVNKNGNDVTPELMKKWLSQIVVALQHVHARGLLHRDIKPQNILLSEDNDVYLCDFGESKRYKQHLKQRNIIGSFFFMAPEVLARRGACPASDIFSLGVTIFCAIAEDKRLDFSPRGQQFFRMLQKRDLLGISKMQQELNKQKLDPNTPRELVNLFKRMTEPEPNKRITIPEIMVHPYFNGVVWKKLGALQL